MTTIRPPAAGFVMPPTRPGSVGEPDEVRDDLRARRERICAAGRNDADEAHAVFRGRVEVSHRVADHDAGAGIEAVRRDQVRERVRLVAACPVRRREVVHDAAGGQDLDQLFVRRGGDDEQRKPLAQNFKGVARPRESRRKR